MTKRRTQQRSSADRQKGFDFGNSFSVILPHASIWTNNLHDAGVTGCAYFNNYEASLQATVPGIALLGYNAEPLTNAFAEFHRWSEGTDNDAVALSIIFLNDGGYLLGLSPEISRWQARTTVPEVMLDPLLMVPTWVKSIDTTHAMIKNIRDYQKKFVAPFLLDAATVDGVPQQSTNFGQRLQRIPSVRPLVKFECDFFDENDSNLTPEAEIVLKMHRLKKIRLRSHRRGPPPAPKRPASQWKPKRRRVLDSLFPVTMFRARRSSLLVAARNHSNISDLQPWQLEQAIANLALSKKLCDGRLHYVGISNYELPKAIVRSSRDYIELADGQDTLKGITSNDVIQQITLDAAFLLREHTQSPMDRDLPTLQKHLRNKRLL